VRGVTATRGSMAVLVVVPFLNEEAYLGTLLDSLANQTRPPDRLVLVNDGSTDGSDAIAAKFAARHDYATLLRRPPRSRGPDRLAAAGPLLAFQWAVDQSGGEWDVLAKLDADVELTPDTIGAIEHQLESDPRLGMAGAYLCEIGPQGVPVRMRSRPDHVHGATTFYRRECYEDIAPLPAIVGWDMIDASRARLRGWRTESIPIPGGDPLHLRPMGVQDGLLRSFRRWGMAAYALGEHPLHVFPHAVQRMGERPLVIGGLNYLFGWALGAVRRTPRAEPELRAFVRRQQLRRIGERLRRLGRR
jgi:poly-beta-1,6-N-acetyl-D-glucosamine synthase